MRTALARQLHDQTFEIVNSSFEPNHMNRQTQIVFGDASVPVCVASNPRC